MRSHDPREWLTARRHAARAAKAGFCSHPARQRQPTASAGQGRRGILVALVVASAIALVVGCGQDPDQASAGRAGVSPSGGSDPASIPAERVCETLTAAEMAASVDGDLGLLQARVEPTGEVVCMHGPTFFKGVFLSTQGLRDPDGYEPGCASSATGSPSGAVPDVDASSLFVYETTLGGAPAFDACLLGTSEAGIIFALEVRGQTSREAAVRAVESLGPIVAGRLGPPVKALEDLQGCDAPPKPPADTSHRGRSCDFGGGGSPATTIANAPIDVSSTCQAAVDALVAAGGIGPVGIMYGESAEAVDSCTRAEWLLAAEVTKQPDGKPTFGGGPYESKLDSMCRDMSGLACE